MKENQRTNKYADILDYDWNESSLKNRMSVSQRAKIFLPFAALTGYEDELDKTLLREIENMKQKTGSIKFWEEMPQKDGI
ncbi:MAG: hypothetical protein K6E69_09665 [Treponema sp.]|uniref:hypothetical protein n=1 Tax=Treponema sp. TaxID=166 RepID=UPI00298E9DF6|nr:hypothetical protein [Treponema sp.]MCR5387373.1 hypothetical protein [Treponema sp.]